MALPNQPTNPLLKRIASDGIFGAAPSPAGAAPPFGQPNGIFGGGMAAAPAKGLIPTAPTPNIFAGGMPPGATDPIHAYAPTGLRDAAINAPINPNDPSMRERAMVWGQGDVMAGYDGMNAQGGRKFSLSQVMPAGDNPVNPQNPIAPENLQARNPGAPQSNSKIAGLLAAFPEDTVTGKYLRAQETAKLPVDIEHLKILAAMDKANDKNDLTEEQLRARAEAEKAKAAAAGQKTNEAAEASRFAAAKGFEDAGKAIKTIDDILPQLNGMTTGWGAAAMDKVPGTAAFNVKALKDQLTSRVMIDSLQEMRKASKTGSSGFGQLSEKEGEVLANAMGNLKLSQDKDQVSNSFKEVRQHFIRMKALYKMGLVDPKNATQDELQNQTAVKWAMSHPEDPRAEQIFLHNQ